MRGEKGKNTEVIECYKSLKQPGQYFAIILSGLAKENIKKKIRFNGIIINR